VLNGVKCLSEIQFKDDDFLFGVLTLVDIFICLSKAILNGSTLNEAILIFMDQR
jgi:hypothetical protein